jgi:hypothetical protein
MQQQAQEEIDTCHTIKSWTNKISISTLINFIIVSNGIRPFKKNLDECANQLQAADGESLDAKSLADLFGAA